MGKKRKAVRNSDEESQQDTADSEDESIKLPAAKRRKNESRDTKVKTSADLCKQFKLKDVELEFTEADYLNLTNYGLFVRMVRPQVQQANPNITSGYMSKLMEVKWKEFREGNPMTKKRREKAEDVEASDKSSVAGTADESTNESEENEGGSSSGEASVLVRRKTKQKKVAHVSDDDEDDIEMPQKPNKRKSGSKKAKGETKKQISKQSPRQTATEESEDVSSEEIETTSKRRSGLVVKLAPLRRSGRDRKRVQKSDSNSDELSDSDEPAQEPSRSRRSRSLKEADASKVDTDEDFEDRNDSESANEDEDSDDSSDERARKRNNSRPNKPLIPGERKSDRRRGDISYVQQSDRDFEKMLKEDKSKAKKKKVPTATLR